MISKEARFKKLEPFSDCYATFPIQLVQPCYRVTESFKESIEDLRKYGRNIMKPVTTAFNEETNEIEYDRNIETFYQEELVQK